MTPATCTAAAFFLVTLSAHLASIVAAMIRCRAPARVALPAPSSPAVTLIRPVCGIDNFIEETLASSFALDYPDYEIIFCVATARDPAARVVERLIAAHPDARARLIVGDERISANPKLNNCFKGWRAAAHDWVVLADHNVLMPRDYLTRLMACRVPDVGLICSPPAGTRPEGFWAEVECAFLNTYQARWQYFADTLGFGFAQGKTMLWQRSLLERAGGIRLLGMEPAEDAASTKVVRAAGRRVRLVDAPFAQPLGRRSAREVWGRQARWAKLRRASFPLFFAPEILSSALLPLITGTILATAADLSPVASFAALAALWYGLEFLLARTAGWPASSLYPLHALIRDAMLPALWAAGWLGTDFVWRGHTMNAEAASDFPHN